MPVPPHTRSVLALDGGFIAMRSKNQNFGVAGNGIWGRASGQRYFGIPVRHQIPVKRVHGGIGSFGLGLHLQDPSQHDNEHGASQ